MSVYRRIDEENRPPWADLTSAGTFRIEPEDRYDPHYHAGHEYWLISRGRGVVELDGERHKLEGGDILAIERGRVHDIVGLWEPLEGFWFEGPVPSGESGGHIHRAPEDAEGHVIPLLTE